MTPLEQLKKQTNEIVNHFMSLGATVSKNDYECTLVNLESAFALGAESKEKPVDKGEIAWLELNYVAGVITQNSLARMADKINELIRWANSQ